jgi:hypothetical protein
VKSYSLCGESFSIKRSRTDARSRSCFRHIRNDFSARKRFFDTLTALFFGKKVLSAQEILFPNGFDRSLWIWYKIVSCKHLHHITCSHSLRCFIDGSNLSWWSESPVRWRFFPNLFVNVIRLNDFTDRRVWRHSWFPEWSDRKTNGILCFPSHSHGADLTDSGLCA